jgi:MFS family permease
MSESNIKNQIFTRSKAMSFIVLLGIVSLFADMTYEGARSIVGPYLAVLGASAALVGFVSGFGEFIGYSLRLASGYLADKTQRYWLITICGYVVNVGAVPLLALTQHWPSAAVLIVMERLGKSIRIPARDAMLSQAGQVVGMGWGFGLHQALDQIGAMLGPFLVAFMLFLKEGYHFGFAILAVPAFFVLVFLLIAYLRYPNPSHLQITQPKIETAITQKLFWIFIIGTAFVALGYADFPLIAYHFEKSNILSPTTIPIAYGIAMGIDGITSPIAGRLYDKYGLLIMAIGVALTASFAPLVFLGGAITAFIGVAVWSIGMGMQTSLMRAIIGNMIPLEKRGSAYGIFNMIYGVSWFIGSVILGVIYDHSIPFVVVFSVLAQLLSLPWLIWVLKRLK